MDWMGSCKLCVQNDLFESELCESEKLKDNFVGLIGPSLF